MLLCTHTETACVAWLRLQGWQVLLRWNVQRGVPVIPRSNTPANIEANAKGLFDWALTESQKVRLTSRDNLLLVRGLPGMAGLGMAFHRPCMRLGPHIQQHAHCHAGWVKLLSAGVVVRGAGVA